MDQIFDIVLSALFSCIFSGLIIKISLSIAKQSWSDNFQYTLICLLLPIITYFKNSKNLVIPEIKYSSKSHLGQFMNDLPFEKTRFSKYCIGLENLDLI